MSEARLTSKNRDSAILKAFPFRLKRSRLEERLNAFQPVGIKCGNGLLTASGIIKDISRNGAGIWLFEAFELANSIEIEFQLLEFSVQAQIRWHRNDDIGVQFDEPIDLDQIPLQLHRSGPDVMLSYFELDRAGSK